VPGSKVSGRYAKFCVLLREARIDADVTQAELAARLRKPQSFVSKVESGERRLDVVELVDVLHALRVDPLAFWRRVGGL